jgi:MFS family permease
MFELFKKNSIFTRFFLGDFLGKVADQYFIVLLPFIALSIIDNPIVLSAILICNAIGRIIMLPFGGILSDRFRPQLLLFANNFIQSAGLIILLLTWFVGSQNLILLGIVALVFGITDGVSLPAGGSITPRIVEKKDLLKANGLISGVEQLTAILGSVLAGFVIAKGGILGGIICSLVIYILSAFSYGTILNIKTEDSSKKKNKLSWWQDFKEGVQEARQNGVVRTVLIFSSTSNIFVTGAVSIGLLLLFKNKFGLGSDIYGLSALFFGLGFFLGLPFLNKLKRIKYPGKFIFLTSFLYLLVFITFALASSVWVIFLALTICGVVVLFDSTITNTWLQTSINSQILGRISSLIIFATIAVDPVGQALAGFIASYNIEATFWIAGFGMLFVAILNYIFNPIMRKRFDLGFD